MSSSSPVFAEWHVVLIVLSKQMTSFFFFAEIFEKNIPELTELDTAQVSSVCQNVLYMVWSLK